MIHNISAGKGQMRQSLKIKDLTKDRSKLNINTDLLHKPQNMLDNHIGCTPLAHHNMIIPELNINTPKRSQHFRSRQSNKMKKLSDMEYGYSKNIFLDDSINEKQLKGMQKDRTSDSRRLSRRKNLSIGSESESLRAFQKDLIINKKRKASRRGTTKEYSRASTRTNPRLKRKNREKRKEYKDSNGAKKWKNKKKGRNIHKNKNKEDEKKQQKIEDLFSENRSFDEANPSFKDQVSNCICKAF